MAVILADDNFKCIFLDEIDRILIQISLKYIPGSSIDNNPALGQVMAWRQTGDEPLPGPILTQLTGGELKYVFHLGSSLFMQYPVIIERVIRIPDSIES